MVGAEIMCARGEFHMQAPEYEKLDLKRSMRGLAITRLFLAVLYGAVKALKTRERYGGDLEERTFHIITKCQARVGADQCWFWHRFVASRFVPWNSRDHTQATQIPRLTDSSKKHRGTGLWTRSNHFSSGKSKLKKTTPSRPA
ncbi:hypothetical protein BaRGS_00020016 [Batillaria attramentaria]|uniref:Uncharacterized protein n=1 Tax=Batillaria attramentaria TaxID=370345 RepID=A0ABD0KNQ9_9CAEN